MARKSSLIILLTSLLLIASTPLKAAVVPTEDPHELVVSYKEISNNIQELNKSVNRVEQQHKALYDLGQFGGIYNAQISKSKTKPKISESAVKALAPVEQQGNNQLSVLKSGQKETTLPSRKTVENAIKKAYQVRDDEEENGLTSKLSSAVNQATGGIMGSSSNNSNSIQIMKKQKNLTQAKQNFSYYTLATGLVNRTLARRSLSDAKQQTIEKTASADTIRAAHTTKTYSIAATADTYNRLLFSGAVGNALLAFKYMDQNERHTSLGMPTVTGVIKDPASTLKGLM